MKATTKFDRLCKTENISVPGISMTVILRADCTGGKLTIIEDEVSVGAGSPLYTCNREDKVMMVVEGKFLVSANGDRYLLEKGCSMFIPKGTVHNFKNVGTATGKLLITLTPCEQNKFLKGLNKPITVFGNNHTVIKKAARKYKVEVA